MYALIVVTLRPSLTNVTHAVGFLNHSAEKPPKSPWGPGLFGLKV